MASWVSLVEVADLPRADLLRKAGLHAGESEAIVLASEVHSEALLMDDRDGVRAATGSGLNVIRTAGVYRLAKKLQIIPAVRPKLDELRKAGSGYDHYRAILESVGE